MYRYTRRPPSTLFLYIIFKKYIIKKKRKKDSGIRVCGILEDI